MNEGILEKREWLANYRCFYIRKYRLQIMQKMQPDRHEEFQTQIDIVDRKMRLIEKAVNNIKDTKAREVVYINEVIGKPLNIIANDLCYSTRQIERFKSIGLKQLEIIPLE